MQAHRFDRLVLRGLVLISLILAVLTLVWTLSPTAVSMAQGQSTPPPRDTPAPARPAPGAERGTVPPPTVPAGTPKPGETPQLAGTPASAPGALPTGGGAASANLTWLFAGIALVVLGSLFNLIQSRRS
jgi:hypothetical protein